MELSRSEFDSLFLRYYPGMCAYASRWVNVPDAEDIVQDVFVSFWNNRSKIKIEKKVSIYLFAATRNRCMSLIERDIIKRKVTANLHEEAMNLTHPGKDSIPEALVAEELTQKFLAALDSLPDLAKKTFLLARVHGKSHKEIADALGIPRQSVNYRLRQAVAQLRRDLSDFLPIFIGLI
ncbi:MAG: RNA polymerase sigma-70 factor [Bacteroidales bacterium]|nr:RNA polymerase sigma-70 factor [Bacteroidales bacterium]